jgi:hypothetical protein
LFDFETEQQAGGDFEQTLRLTTIISDEKIEVEEIISGELIHVDYQRREDQ